MFFKNYSLSLTDGIPTGIRNYPAVSRSHIDFLRPKPIWIYILNGEVLRHNKDKLLELIEYRMRIDLEIRNSLFYDNHLFPSSQCPTKGLIGIDKPERIDESLQYFHRFGVKDPLRITMENVVMWSNPNYDKESRYSQQEYIDIDPILYPFLRMNHCFTTMSQVYPEDYRSNSAGNPMWKDPENGDFTPMPGSPLVDAGTIESGSVPETDLLGNPRVSDGNGDGVALIDIGPVELQAP